MNDNGTMIEKVREICGLWQNRAEALIEILHDVQETVGCVPKTSMPVIAEQLNLSNAEIYGVVSFYHDFRTEPAAGPVVRLCRAESCQAMGCEDLAKALETEVDWPGSVRPEIRTVYCLGNCALSPAAMVGERLIGRADPGKIVEALGDGSDVSEEEHHG